MGRFLDIYKKSGDAVTLFDKSPLKRELLLFLVSGCSAVATDATVYFGLFHLGIAHAIAKSLSFCAGSFVAYILNKYLTFSSPERSTSEVVRFALLYLTTLGVNTAINSGALWLLGTHMSVLAFLLATGTSTVLNFLGQKYFVFNKGKAVN